MSPAEKSDLIRTLARQAGFERVGIAAARPINRGDHVRRWLAEGQAGEMAYLHRNLDKRLHPGLLIPGAKSVVVVALNYHQPERPPTDGRARGRVAMYAWGRDYHRVVKKKLFAVIDRLRKLIPEPFEAKACVDTAPVLERELALQAGIGWIGKNTLVLHQDVGSYFFLGEIVTTLDLQVDPPATDHCGSCTRCLEACPTQAFPAPYQMDARRCISYHTIELRSDIPAEFHEAIGDWVFGCDICQQVCPFNQEAPNTCESEFEPRGPGSRPLLSDLLAWDDATYRDQLRGSAMKRAKPPMFRRNAQIAQANQQERQPQEGEGAR